MAGEACEHCGAFALDLDAQTGVCACEACGRVVECEDLQHQTHGFQDGVWERAPGQLVTDQQAGLVSAELGRSEKNQDQLLDSLRGFTSALSLGRKTVREGESLVIETKHYYATGAVEKNLYLGVIIYIAARQCSVPITLYEIASCIGRPHRELIQKYRRLVKFCNLLIPGHNLSAYVDRFVEDLIGYLEAKEWLKKNASNPEQRCNEIVQTKSDRALLLEPPTKVDVSEAVFDLQEFVLQRMAVPGCKPLVFAGGVLALAVDSKYGKQKADAVNYYLCEKFGLLNNQLKGFKVKVRKGLLAVCQQLPGFVSMTLSKIRRHVTDVLKAWKALMKLEEHCVEHNVRDLSLPLVIQEERVGPTPLVELLQEAGVIGDVSGLNMNRGFCPPENYKRVFPAEMSRFMAPSFIGVEGMSTDSDSRDEPPEATCNQVEGEHEVEHPTKKQRTQQISWLEPVPVPGSRNTFTRSIAVDQVGPSDIRTFPRARPKMARKALQQATAQRQRAEKRRSKLEASGQETTSCIADPDEFAREGLSDLDEEELGQYVLNPREAAIKAMVTDCSGYD